MKFHEPGITALFLLFLVSTIYLAPIAEKSAFFSDVSGEMPKENVELEKLIFESCKKAGIVAPIFNEDGDYVKVIFEFKPQKDVRKADDEILIDYFKAQQVLTIREIITYLGRSKNTAFKVLHKLIDKGLVKQVGKGPATRYVFGKEKDL